MKENSVKVYTNKTLCGELTFEDEQYVFNYENSAKYLTIKNTKFRILKRGLM